jgi:hypothetical protein
MIKRITIISVMILGLVFLSGCEPGDTEDPTVSITQPADNAVVSGTVEIKATADDNEGVTKVEFYVDGDLKGTDNEAADSEYSYSWDASGETPGSSHTANPRLLRLLSPEAEGQPTTRAPYQQMKPGTWLTTHISSPVMSMWRQP